MKPRLPLLLLLAALSACGGHDKALRVALTSLNTARDGFVAYDARRQQDIVQEAPSYEEGVSALKKYRTAREPVLHSFQAAYAALALAALDPKVENLQTAALDVKKLYDLIQKLRSGP